MPLAPLPRSAPRPTPRPKGSGPSEPLAAGAGALRHLLRDLGGRVWRGGLPEEPPGRCRTGLAGLDALLGGGLPRGRLSEIAGPSSSGRTSLALALLARATAAGSLVAVVDASDALDPESARASGVALSRVLWVRAPGQREALRSTEQLLRASGFALVLLDLERLTTRSPGGAGRTPGAEVPAAVWLRLARAAAGSATALVVLCAQRTVGSFAALGVEMQPEAPCFEGAPALLQGLHVRARLVRNRLGASGGPCAPDHATPVRLHASDRIALDGRRAG